MDAQQNIIGSDTHPTHQVHKPIGLIIPPSTQSLMLSLQETKHNSGHRA